MEITDVLDLHCFRPKEIGDLVEGYLRLASQQGLRRVRLIHGKGIGVQRSRVHAILERQPLVVAWGNMPPEAGGWGATWVELGKNGQTTKDLSPRLSTNSAQRSNLDRRKYD